MESPIHDVICPTTLESVQLHWNLYHVIPKGQHRNMSNYVGICPTTLKPFQLQWRKSYPKEQKYLSNYVGICPNTLESIHLSKYVGIYPSVQLRWNQSNYFRTCPTTLECYSNFRKSYPKEQQLLNL